MKLLLVEFAALDRFHRAVLFPFIQGYARSAGITTRWLRFAVRASTGPSEADSAALDSVIRDFAPDLVLFDADLDPGTRPLDSLLGRNDPAVRGSGLFENVVPDYGFEPANPAARELEPLPFVFVGEECTYDRSFSSNPFLASLTLDECVRREGCAFCTRPPHRGPWKITPEDLLVRQLEAIARTLPGAGGGLQIRLVGELAVSQIEALAAAAAVGPIRPLTLLIDSRPDRFLQAFDPLKRALESLESSDCRIEMALMGVENFCSRELGRLNKGLTPETNLRAIRQLFELEQAFPSSFGFRRHGGLSMITFNPWTSPTELVLNLMVIRMLGLEELAGKLLTGRLRLYPELPLTGAARRDGLLIDRYPDPLLDTARLNMYAPETPWKFAHPEMEALNRLFVRLAPEVRMPQDPITRALDSAGAGDQGVTPQTLDVAIRLLDGAMQAGWSGSHPDPETLIQKTLAPSKNTDTWLRYEDLVSDGLARIGNVEIKALLDLKPVIKLEPVTAGDCRRLEQDPAFSNLRYRKRGFGGPPGAWEVFFGLREKDVEEAMLLTEELDRKSGRAFARAITRLGLLLGYPSCCVTAFADERAWMQDNFFWLHIKRRIENPGEVPCELNPAANPLLEYVPCSLACEESINRARRIPPPGRLRNPSLLFWAGQEYSLELIPKNEPSERFRYRPGHVMGSDPLIQAVCRGDELVLEDECITILKQGRPFASLSGRAFLWWHRRSFQTGFWQALLEVLADHDPRWLQQAESTTAAPPVRPTAFSQSLSDLLEKLMAEGTSFGGFALEKSEITAEGRVRVVLVAERDRAVLDIGPKRPGDPCYLEAGPFLLTYPMDSPIDTENQRKAAQEFADALSSLSRAPDSHLK